MRALTHTRPGRQVNGRLIWLTLIHLVLVCWLLMEVWISSAQAQEPEPWAAPVLLSEGMGTQPGVPSKSSYSIVLADEWGGAHAIWVTTYDEDAIIGDTLYYSYWDGTIWSPPVNILYTPRQLFWTPKVAVDARGRLHLAWTDNQLGQIWYAQAPVAEAGSVHGWSLPVRVTDQNASGLSIATDSEGVVHLVYCAGGEYSGVYHVSSSDDESWSTPDFVGNISSDSTIKFPECKTGQAVDDRGRLHAVWGQSLAQKTSVYYARSDDGGLSWLPPLEIDRLDERYEGIYVPGRPNILSIGPDQVHVVWFGAPLGQRWHRWSADGGDTWSSPEQIHPLLRGFMEPPALAADSAGTLHLVSMGWLELEGETNPSGAFHTYWRDGRWSPPTLIEHKRDERSTQPQPSEGGGEFAALAVTEGNKLHAVWELDLSEIWASNLRTDALHVPPKPRPTPQTSPTTQIMSSATPVATPINTQATPAPTVVVTRIPSATTLGGGYTWQRAILISLVPSILLVGVVVLIQRARG